MNQAVMNIVQQAQQPAGLTLGAQARFQSITLRTGRKGCVLKVERGMAWVTLPGTSSQAPQDLWLQAGQTLPLAGKQTLWVDGWPHAELSLQALEQAPVRQLYSLVIRLVSRFKRRAAASSLPCSAA
jgi:hypothetical protein